MSTNLWDTTQTESSSTEPAPAAAPSTTSGSDQSPLSAAIEASSWSRADIELALEVAQIALLAVWVYTTYHE
jgi:hypothetical protein